MKMRDPGGPKWWFCDVWENLWKWTAINAWNFCWGWHILGCGPSHSDRGF